MIITTKILISIKNDRAAYDTTVPFNNKIGSELDLVEAGKGVPEWQIRHKKVL